jgi:hypothetical protein
MIGSSAMPFRSLIFDFNGTLSDDEHLMEAITAEVLARHATPPTHRQYIDRLAGLSDEAMVRTWLGDREDVGGRGVVLESSVGSDLLSAQQTGVVDAGSDHRDSTFHGQRKEVLLGVPVDQRIAAREHDYIDVTRGNECREHG